MDHSEVPVTTRLSRNSSCSTGLSAKGGLVITKRRWKMLPAGRAWVVGLLTLACAGAGLGFVLGPASARAVATAANRAKGPAAKRISDDWPTYLHDVERSSASADTTIGVKNAANLTTAWTADLHGTIASEPAVLDGVVYVGSWDGDEYAINADTGKVIWKRFLGIDHGPNCFVPEAGVSSSATVYKGVVYVGGGGPYWYALRASTGAVLWKVYTGPGGVTGAHYNWSSPLIVNGFAYVDVSSLCNDPTIQAAVLKVSLTKHAIVSRFDVVPNGQIGGSVWASPTYDPATKTVFVATGSLGLYTQKYAEAIIALNANTMKAKSYWELPFAQANWDSDFGTTPTLTTGFKGEPLVSLADKNGRVYTFRRNDLAAGPVWQREIAVSGDCPPCGDGSISPGAFGRGVLYYAGGNTLALGAGHLGSVTAFDPATGKAIWKVPMDQPVVPALVYDNGLVIVLEGNHVEVLDAATGRSVYVAELASGTYGAPAVAEGKIFFGTTGGTFYALKPGRAPTTPPRDRHCPSGFTCRGIGFGLAGSESTSGGVLTIKGSGAPIGTARSDNFRFVSKPWSGDGQMSVKLSGQSSQGPAGSEPQAGLMMRQSAAKDSPFYAVTESPGASGGTSSPLFEVWARSAWNQPASELAEVSPARLPVHLMIQRQGQTLSTAESSDGKHWTLVPGTSSQVVMTTSLLSGMMVDSGSNRDWGTARFRGFSLGKLSMSPAPVSSANPCPSGWSCQDVGNPAGPGDQSFAGGSWTINGSGAGIGGTGGPTASQDQFHFVYQALGGDGAISAEVANPGSNPGGSTAGLMMRENLTAGSPYYAILSSPGGGTVVQWREHDSLPTRQSVPVSGIGSPEYFEIQRYTDTSVSPPVTYYSAFTSANGTTWTPVLGATQAVRLGSKPFTGMFAANPESTTDTAAVTMTSVSLAPGKGPRPPGVCPSPWSCADVGTGVAIPGGQDDSPGTGSGRTWSFYAGGTDIYSIYDNFHYAYQPLKGDVTFSTEVASASGAGDWEKAGVMIRSAAEGATDPQAPYYAVFATPSKGVVVQWRTTERGETNQVQISGTEPVYVMVTRHTDAHKQVHYTGYESTNGSTWTQIPKSSEVLDLPGPLEVGMAADSYESTNATVVFDDPILVHSSSPPREHVRSG